MEGVSEAKMKVRREGSRRSQAILAVSDGDDHEEAGTGRRRGRKTGQCVSPSITHAAEIALLPAWLAAAPPAATHTAPRSIDRVRRRRPFLKFPRQRPPGHSSCIIKTWMIGAGASDRRVITHHSSHQLATTYCSCWLLTTSSELLLLLLLNHFIFFILKISCFKIYF
jgi:hypothetical protein